MLGSEGIITVKMAKGQIKKKEKESNNNGKTYWMRLLKIAMIVIVAVIAIILVSIVKENVKMKIDESARIENIISNINVEINQDETITKFVRDYFEARTNLNYPKIFHFYDRDYYKEERDSNNNSFKKIVDNIRYEKMFVKGYDNINIYVENGFYENEILCIVTYDMIFGFTTDKAPNIILFYLEKRGDTYIIKENFDIGTSKYIVEVVNTELVKKLYEDVYIRLHRVLISNENLKLVYNSFRQSEMNMKSALGSLHKKEIIDKINSNKIDPIRDIKKIYDEISKKKQEENNKKKLENYLNRVIASYSNSKRK